MSLLNQPAPDLALVDLETGDVSSLLELIQTTKRPTIVLFYASWSRACITEVEKFEEWSKNGNHKLVNFVLVNIEQNIGEALKFVDQPSTKPWKACKDGETRPRVCRDYRLDDDEPTVLHFACDDVPAPYALHQVPHKVVLDEKGIVKRDHDLFYWDDISDLLVFKQVEKLVREDEKVTSYLFPPLAT